MLFWIASGKHIDPEKSPKYSEILEDLYRNPFEDAQKKPMTAAEIKQHLLQKIRETRARIAEG